MPFIDEGQGKPILFLHGYLSNKESFFLQTEYFKRFRRVIAPDMVGFGGTKMPYPYSLDDYARDIRSLIGSVGGKADVVAHSFGARVLFKLLPCDGVDKIVLTGAAGIRPRRSLKKSFSVFRYKLRKNLGLDVSKFGSPDYRALDGVMKRSFVKVVNERLEDRIKSVKNSTLIVYGEKDKETPPYMQRKLNRLISGSTLVGIKGAGHFAFVEKPVEFNAIVKEFLS